MLTGHEKAELAESGMYDVFLPHLRIGCIVFMCKLPKGGAYLGMTLHEQADAILEEYGVTAVLNHLETIGIFKRRDDSTRKS